MRQDGSRLSDTRSSWRIREPPWSPGSRSPAGRIARCEQEACASSAGASTWRVPSKPTMRPTGAPSATNIAEQDQCDQGGGDGEQLRGRARGTASRERAEQLVGAVTPAAQGGEVGRGERPGGQRQDAPPPSRTTSCACPSETALGTTITAVNSTPARNTGWRSRHRASTRASARTSAGGSLDRSARPPSRIVPAVMPPPHARRRRGAAGSRPRAWGRRVPRRQGLRRDAGAGRRRSATRAGRGRREHRRATRGRARLRPGRAERPRTPASSTTTRIMIATREGREGCCRAKRGLPMARDWTFFQRAGDRPFSARLPADLNASR